MTQNDSKKPIEYKLYNSGSFFDETDVPRKLRLQIVDMIRKTPRVFKLGVESRPEHILNHLDEVKETQKILDPTKLEIGIGFESSNDAILTDCWNKGISVEYYRKTVKKIRALDIRIKTYIFIKPPFLTEKEAIIDAINTAHDAIAIGTDVISLNPCNIQKGTLVNFLHKQDRYQPPWLWSVLHIVKSIRDNFPDLEIICEPSAVGKVRGTHNCSKCDSTVFDLINRIINHCMLLF
jgi:radical SAM enzyme (TIGR01210 family)